MAPLQSKSIIISKPRWTSPASSFRVQALPEILLPLLAVPEKPREPFFKILPGNPPIDAVVIAGGVCLFDR